MLLKTNGEKIEKCCDRIRALPPLLGDSARISRVRGAQKGARAACSILSVVTCTRGTRCSSAWTKAVKPAGASEPRRRRAGGVSGGVAGGKSVARNCLEPSVQALPQQTRFATTQELVVLRPQRWHGGVTPFPKFFLPSFQQFCDAGGRWPLERLIRLKCRGAKDPRAFSRKPLARRFVPDCS